MDVEQITARIRYSMKKLRESNKDKSVNRDKFEKEHEFYSEKYVKYLKNTLSKTLPKIIYHYTNIDAMANMLSTHALWLSHASCVNDISEGDFGFRQIFNYLSKRATPEQSRYLFYFFHRKDQQDIRRPTYSLISFCEGGDLLSQWRSYSNDGSGIALGIDVQKLKISCSRLKNIYFGKCVYADEEIVKFLTKVYPRGDVRHTLKTGLFDFYFMPVWASFIKQEAFHEEREYRIISAHSAPEKYRKIGTRLVPYEEFSLGDDYSWLKEVLIGPCHNQYVLETAVRAKLREFKINKMVEVKVSKIPYRDLRYY